MKRIFALIVAVAMIATLCVFTSAEEVTDGLVAHYALSSDLTDSVGSADGSVIYKNVTDTTTEGSSEVTYSDGALVIADGSDVGVKFPVSGITSDFTVSVTVEVLASSRGWASPFIWIGGTDQSTENWIGIWTGFDNGSWIDVGSNDADGHRVGVESGISEAPMSATTFTLVVESNVAYYYVNGALVGQSNGTGAYTSGTWITSGYSDFSSAVMPNPWSADDCAIYIAANAWGDANVNATYSDLYVYNRALTSTEVATLCGVEVSSGTTSGDDTTAADDTTTAAASTSNVEVDLTNATVIDDGGGSWGSDSATVASMAFDGDTSTFYDSNSGENAYVGVQLAEATAIQGFAVYPRAGYAYRLEGALIQGSTDNETWVTLYTIAADEYTEGEWTVYEITDTTAYTYYRLLTPSTNCNPAEIVLYSTYSTGSTGSTAVSPQTGFAFVGLGVVALASGTAIVVSKKRH
ncbi:MAG: discoidin domain-containing protein [Clostridia bacterium]|nr:discoidin domain-containing protein [Clostridia bacterium]